MSSRIDDDGNDPRMKLRPNTSDKLHALHLLRDVAIINARTVRERGLLPPGGLPVQPKRKPDLPHPSESLSIKEDEMNPLQKIAAATALAASTLAACGKAHPPEAPAEATPVPVPASVVEAPAVPPPVADAAEMEIKRGPAIPAAVLRKQILTLLDSLQSLEHMEHEHVESIFKVRMTKNPRSRDGYQYFGITTEGWTYYVNVTRLHGLSNPPTIAIGLSNGVEPWTALKPAYCTLDFEELAQDIVVLGYLRDARRVLAGGKPVWGFGRDVPTRRAGFGVGVYLYYLDEGIESEQACVTELRIGGDVIDG